MSDRLTITIEGRNGTKQIFDAVAQDSTRMSQAVIQGAERAGLATEQFAASTTEMASTTEASSARTSASYEKIGNTIGKIGLAFGGFSLLAGKAAGDSEASAARERVAFENAGLAIEDYQTQLNKLNSTGLHLGFDDEDVQDSLSRFVAQTKNVQQSIADVNLAENIARATGESLATATATVSQVEAGRFRGLASLGIALDATSTKQDYLAQLQTKYAGSAAEYATTGAANFERWKNAGENALESIGEKLEGLQLPLIALSTAGASLGPLVGSLKGLAAESVVLDAALGPIGLAAAALAAGAGIYYLLTQTKEYDDAATTAAGSTQDLTNYFRTLAQALDPINAQALLNFNIALNETIDDAAKRQADLQALLSLQSLDSMGLSIDPVNGIANSFADLTQAQLEYIDTNKDMVISVEEINAAVAQYQSNLDRLDSSQIKAAQDDVKAIFDQSGVDYAKAIAGISEWEAELKAGTITGEQFVSMLDNAASDFTVFGREVGTATTAVATHTAAVAKSGQAIADQMAAYDAQNRSLGQAIDFTLANTAAIVENTKVIENQGSVVGQTTSVIDTYSESQQSSIGYAFAVTEALGKQTDALSLVSDAVDAAGAAAVNAAPDTKQFADGLDELTQKTQAAEQAQRDQLGGWYDLAQGIYTADSAQAAFKATQDGLIGSENVYNAQLSEYSSNLNSLKGAYDIIQQKQADGIQLSQDELNFLDKYPDAYARLTGGQDDATESAGMMALQYAENMKAGDELNKSVKDQTKSTGDLVDEIKDLIDILLGVPPDVKSNVHVDGLDSANSALSFMKKQLHDLDGLSATAFATVVHNNVGNPFAQNPNTTGETATGRLGGMMGYANGGIVARMGEPGPELLRFANGGMGLALTDGTYTVPRGTMVTPAPETKNRLAGLGGDTYHIANLTIVANDPESFGRQMLSRAVSGSRR